MNLNRKFQIRYRNINAYFHYSRALAAFRPSGDIILLFHGIDDIGNQKFNLRFTSQRDFLFIINGLKQYYTVCSLTELLTTTSSRPRMAVTFDDGYKNWKTHLFPLLERQKIPATLYITRHTKPMLWPDQYDIFRWYHSQSIVVGDRLFEKVNGIYQTPQAQDLNTFLKKSNENIIDEFQTKTKISDEILNATRLYWELLSDAEIQELSKSPLIEIGSHGCTHASLNELEDDSLKAELNKSKTELEMITGKQIDSIAFPSGNYDSRVVTLSKSVGYKTLLAENFLYPETDPLTAGLFRREGVYTTGNRYYQTLELLKRL